MIPPLHIDNLNKFNKRGGEIEEKVVKFCLNHLARMNWQIKYQKN